MRAWTPVPGTTTTNSPTTTRTAAAAERNRTASRSRFVARGCGSTGRTTRCGQTTSLRSWPGDARAVRRCNPPARAGRRGLSPRPPSAGADRGGDRASRAGSGQALDRGRVWPADQANRNRAADRRRVAGAPSGGDAHRRGSHEIRMCRVGGAVADCVLLNWMLPPKRRGRADGCRKVPTRRDAPPQSSLRTSASPWTPARCSSSATRRAITATSTRVIESISRGSARERWRGGIGAIGGAQGTGARTTPRSTSRSHGCSQITMPRRCSPPRWQRHSEAPLTAGRRISGRPGRRARLVPKQLTQASADNPARRAPGSRVHTTGASPAYVEEAQVSYARS